MKNLGLLLVLMLFSTLAFAQDNFGQDVSDMAHERNQKRFAQDNFGQEGQEMGQERNRNRFSHRRGERGDFDGERKQRFQQRRQRMQRIEQKYAAGELSPVQKRL